MKVPFSFLTEQFADPEPIFARIREFLTRCDFTLGHDLAEFEARYARYCGVKHAIGVGSGTDALFFALKAAGVAAGDEVITPPNSFIATTGAIVQAGARPVYVEIGPDQNIDPALIEAAITPKTKAILPVHWAGAPCDLTAILAVANRHGLPVVEDACQALGAEHQGRRVGGLGLAGGFSVHPLKPLHVWGDGGVVVTQSDEVAAKIRLWRNHGMSDRDTIAVYGYNSRFDNLQAIVGLHVMETLDDTISSRIAHAERFDAAFRTGEISTYVHPPARRAGDRHVFHLYIVRVKNRDGLLRHLVENGIEAKVHYPIPLHLQPAAASLGYAAGDFALTESDAFNCLTLPCHQYLSREQIDYTIATVKGFYGVGLARRAEAHAQPTEVSL